MQTEFYTYIAEISDGIQTTAFTLIGASILIFVSNSYFRPDNIKHRIPFLLFVPAWILLFLSSNHGLEVDHLMYTIIGAPNPDKIPSAPFELYTNYISQIRFFQLATIPLAIWAIYFVCWWVFNQQKISSR